MSVASANHSSTPDTVLARTAARLAQVDRGLPLATISHRTEFGNIEHNALLTVTRHRAVIDWTIDALASRRVRPRLRNVLRWGLTQILYMDGLSVPMAVDTCVRFVKRRYSGRESGFVNAVLRQASEQGRHRLLESVRDRAPAHVRSELGAQLQRRWARRFPDADLQALARLLLTPAPLTVRLRPQAPVPNQAGLEPLPAPSWAPAARLWHCTDPKTFFASAAFQRNDYYVQDPATLLAPALLELQPGETAADLCTAPGGKALLLAEALGPADRLVCLDRSAQRLRRARANLPPACLLAVADAGNPPFAASCFDAALLDVPCSNSGVVRRRPDVRWHFSPAALRRLTSLQTRILNAAATLVKPGGRLVYSTCSLEPEENRGQVDTFLSSHPDFDCDTDRELLPGPMHDGGYAARLTRCRAHQSGPSPGSAS